jgi:hypothetical protein
MRPDGSILGSETMTPKPASKPTMRLKGTPVTASSRARAVCAHAMVGALTLSFGAASAQTHKVAKPENVVRAVGVYEWTGDMAKPTASRLVPVSLFIDGKLQDAGVYLASPVPLALLSGNLYEVDEAGVPKGTVDLMFSRHFEVAGADATNYDDGWFGYGKFAPPQPPRKSTLRPTKTLAVINEMDDDSDKPHFSAKSATPGSGGSAAPAPGAPAPTADAPPDDPDRPTFHRSGGGSGQTASSGPETSSSGTAPTSPTAPTDTPATDPNRPTLHRTDPQTTSDAPGSTAPSGSGTTGSSTTADTRDTPPDDADRPTLRRRTPEEAKKTKVSSQASVSGVGSLNDDPNRPTLHRGEPEGSPTAADIPRLIGLPGDQDLHQMVAVSDSANRSVHDFSLAFADDAERQAILAKMQAAARAQLTAYEAANRVTPVTPPPSAATPDTRHPNSKLRRAPTPAAAPAPPEALIDEKLNAYTLSYGGAPTYVFSAHTDGLGPTLRFVTVVAQVNMQGEPEVALKSVTDAGHLDRTPRMKLVDAVDVEASNRASLLFELREQNSRQFAIYRVIGARSEQIFLTGTTQ